MMLGSRSSGRLDSRVEYPGRAWAIWLMLLILAIAFSPRLRLGVLGGKALDVRIQDIMLAPTILALALSRVRLPDLGLIWGKGGVFYVYWAVVAASLNLLISQDHGMIRTTAFLGRGLEMFAVALAIAGCYTAAVTHARRAAFWAITVAVWVNLLWMLYQALTGTQAVLFGSLGDTIEAYGPKLVGEPSSFGTGFFCVFAVAWGVAEFRAEQHRQLALATIALACTDAFYAQSRISLGVVVALVSVGALRPRNGGGVHWFNAMGIAGLGTYAALNVPRNLQGRLSPAGIATSTADRVNGIWEPLLRTVSEHPLLGIGPGSLGTPAYPQTEAHNAVLRAALDFGVPGALLLVIVLATILVRSWGLTRHASSEVRLFATLAFLTTAAAVASGVVQESLTAVMSTHLTMLAVGLLGGAVLSAGEELAFDEADGGSYRDRAMPSNPVKSGSAARSRRSMLSAVATAEAGPRP